MSVTTYSGRVGPKPSIPQISCVSTIPNSPVGVEATITSAKKNNEMSTIDVESNENSDPVESDYSEDDGKGDEGSSASEEEEEDESYQKSKSESDNHVEADDDDSDEDSDDGDKGGRQFSLDDFQILKTVGKIYSHINIP